MIQVRQGQIRDCKDMLTVYRTTRFPERNYESVSEVRQEHELYVSRRWGWLVADADGPVIGEVVFDIEHNCRGPVGIILGLDVDARYQRQGVGRMLTSAAESFLGSRGVRRVVVESPPDAYNYWMRLGYFSVGGLARIRAPLKSIAWTGRNSLDRILVDRENGLSRVRRFHTLGRPGGLTRLIGDIVNGTRRGLVAEFRCDNRSVGLGAVVKCDGGEAVFSADVTEDGIEHYGEVIERTVRLASTLRAKSVETAVPADRLDDYSALCSWTVEPHVGVPLMKLL
ncbi:MAG: GNAT family N-acetyltransferase [Candidatus Thorarchaeota archaeon]